MLSSNEAEGDVQPRIEPPVVGDGMKLEALPAPLVSVINQPKVTEAYFLPERGRYVARHVLPDGRKEELEYDALGRTLAVAERSQKYLSRTGRPTTQGAASENDEAIRSSLHRQRESRSRA